MIAAVANPLLPTHDDVVWTVIALVALVLTLVALVQVLRSRAVRGVEALGWIVVILALPVLGAAAWFVLGTRTAEAVRG